MPYEPYVTVTLRRDIVGQLSKVDPGGDKSTSAKVTDAILEYVNSKTGKPTRGTKGTKYVGVSGTWNPPLLPSP